MEPQTFSTSGVPASQQLDAYLGWLNGTVEVLPNHSPRNGFHVQSHYWQFDGCMLSRVEAPAICVERNSLHIRRTPMNHWAIAVGRQATSTISTGDKMLRASPGTPFVLSLEDAATVDRPADARLQLYMSRDKFPDLVPALDRAHGTVVGTPHGALLRDYLRLLEATLPHVASDELERLSDAIGAMVAACLVPEQDRAASATPQIALMLLERVRKAVRGHLRSPKLGPRLLCQLLSISRSKLYHLTDAEGGVARYIRRQRLLEAYVLLSDPSTERTISAIADELCFADMSSFGRAFSREFGASPSDVRAASRALPTPDQSPAPDNRRTGSGFISLLRAV